MATEIVQAGPELDAQVARRVFARNYRLVPSVCINDRWVEMPTWLMDHESPESPGAGAHAGMTPPRYSTDIAAAWLVVDKMREQGWMCMLTIGIGGETMAVFNRPDSPSVVDVGSTPSLAICSAALAARDVP